MRYLDKRNDFLKNQKKINENVARTTGGSGPFANDLGWHDSLVGRFINHLIRKAQIKYKSGKIKNLAGRLEETFDAMIAESAISEVENGDLLLLKAMLLRLSELVEGNEEKSHIIEATKNPINLIESGKTGDFEEKEEILRELKEFLAFLEQLEEEKEETEEVDIDSLMVSNLTSLMNIMKTIGVKQEQPKEKEKFDRTKIEVDKYYLRRDKSGKISLLKIVSTDKDNKGEKLDDNVVIGLYYVPGSKKWHNTTTFATKDSIFKEVRVNGDSLNQEDIKLVTKEPVKVPELVTKSSGVDESYSINESEESTPIVDKLKSSVVLLTKNDKGFSITPDTLQSLINNFNEKSGDSEYIMNNLYKEIYSCIKGKRAKTVADPDPLVVESYEAIANDKLKMIPIMGELIAKFAKRSKQYEEGELYNKLGDVGKFVHEFNTTLKKILNSGIGEPNYSTKKEEVKEGILNYKNFILIKEDKEEGEIENREVTEPETPTLSTKINDYFTKKCLGMKAFVMDKTEMDKINKNLEQIQKDQKNEFVINGMDPVIEIVKLFNRAYKTFTFSYMTKRTGASGGVGVTTAAQYTAIGGASADGRQGPYRNNKIFDIWENAVLDIFKNKKYQHIFLPTTKMKLPKVENPSGPDDYVYVKNAGSNLKKFMLDILDGENLYKTGSSSGKQKEFINKYFGDVNEETQKKLDKAGDEESTELQKEVSELPTTNIKFVDSGKSKNVMKEGSFISLKGINKEGKEVQRHIMISSIDSGMAYVVVSNAFGRFRKYISKLDGKRKFDNGDYTNIKNQNADIRYTKIKPSEFEMLLKDGNITIKAMNNEKEVVEETIAIGSSYWLVVDTEGELEPFKAEDKKQLKDIVEQSGDKFNVADFVSTGPADIKISKG